MNDTFDYSQVQIMGDYDSNDYDNDDYLVNI
jgi:hypothetical protein